MIALTMAEMVCKENPKLSSGFMLIQIKTSNKMITFITSRYLLAKNHSYTML
ncbi:hypothetical protein VCJ_001184 [Vibrio metoecus]|nr:hypothetical protein VCJ_001184 [Vibrio metoecus]